MRIWPRRNRRAAPHRAVRDPPTQLRIIRALLSPDARDGAACAGMRHGSGAARGGKRTSLTHLTHRLWSRDIADFTARRASRLRHRSNSRHKFGDCAVSILHTSWYWY